MEFVPPCPGSVSPWAGLAGGLWGSQPVPVLVDKPYASAPTRVQQSLCGRETYSCVGGQEESQRHRKAFISHRNLGREIVDVTLAALSGESTVCPNGVMQGTGGSWNPGGNQGYSWRGSLSTGKRYGGIFELVGCLGSLTSLHGPLTHLAGMSSYCPTSVPAEPVCVDLSFQVTQDSQNKQPQGHTTRADS